MRASGVTCATATAGGGLEKLCKADKLVVGVKFDQPLFGLKDPTTGKVEGFDVEIAKLIATALGKNESQIDFQETVSKVREDVIVNGQRDYVVATYTINDDRKTKVGFAGPYYVAGQDIMVKKGDTSITGKESLDGKKVCTAVGSTPEKRLREETKAEVVTFEKYSECAEALRDGRVDAVSTDNVILLGLIQQSDDAFELVGKPFSTEPYGIGVPLADKELRGFVNDVLEKAYADGSWQKAYDATIGTVDAAQVRASGGRSLLVSVGDYGDLFWEGFKTTLSLTLLSFAIAMVIGVVIASMRVSPIRPLRAAGLVYVETFRNIPLLLILLFIVFGLPKLDVTIDFFPAAVVGCSLYTGAFVAEAVRSGINAVGLGQGEAARSIGLTFGQSMRYIVLPQALRNVVAPVGQRLHRADEELVDRVSDLGRRTDDGALAGDRRHVGGHPHAGRRERALHVHHHPGRPHRRRRGAPGQDRAMTVVGRCTTSLAPGETPHGGGVDRRVVVLVGRRGRHRMALLRRRAAGGPALGRHLGLAPVPLGRPAHHAATGGSGDRAGHGGRLVPRARPHRGAAVDPLAGRGVDRALPRHPAPGADHLRLHRPAEVRHPVITVLVRRDRAWSSTTPPPSARSSGRDPDARPRSARGRRLRRPALLAA